MTNHFVPTYVVTLPTVDWWFNVTDKKLYLHINIIFFFQCTFAATCVTIVSGAIAERCNFNGYIIFCVLVTGVTYPIAAHWCWGPSGWLSDLGFVDFAGSGVVHLSGGVCALVGTSFISHTCSAFY